MKVGKGEGEGIMTRERKENGVQEQVKEAQRRKGVQGEIENGEKEGKKD